MDSKVVLITGGSSGIGKAIGTFLTTKGLIVYGTARSAAKYPDFKAFKLIDLDVRARERVGVREPQVKLHREEPVLERLGARLRANGHD